MANLTIRKLDNAVVARLKDRAKAHNRSLEAELREILGAAARPSAPVDLRALAERCDAVLRIGGDSAGADREVSLILGRGGRVFQSTDEIPAANKA